MDVRALIRAIQANSDCIVYPPNGLPIVAEGDSLPQDLRLFYELCGGIDMFQSSEFYMEILPPEAVVLATPVIRPILSQVDIAEDNKGAWWSLYLIADYGNSDY